MNEQQQETLSALFDGETSEFEARRLLSEIDDNDRQRWQRYQLIRDASTNKLDEGQFTFNIADKVAAAIEAEDAPSLEKAPATAVKTQWFKPVVGFAAAASVAFVAVLGIQDPDMVSPGFIADGNVSASQLQISGDQGLSQVSGSSPIEPLAGENRNRDEGKLQNTERLQHYLQQHSQHAAFNNGRGLVPMARMQGKEY